MATDTTLVLWAFVFFQVKHLCADFLLQTYYQLANKGRYGHPGGLLHAGIHGAASLPVFLILTPASPLFAGAIILGEMLLHYHIDWTKENVVRHFGWNSENARFWYALGTDQAAHQLTYLGMIALLA